jgi:hypothetical protein
MIFFFFKFWHLVFSAKQKYSGRIVVMPLICRLPDGSFSASEQKRALEAQGYLSPFLGVTQGTLVPCLYRVPVSLQMPCMRPGVVVHNCYSSIWEAEAGRFLVRGQPRQHIEIFCPHWKKKKKPDKKPSDLKFQS